MMRKLTIIILILFMILNNSINVKAEDVDGFKPSLKKVVFLTFDDGPSCNNTTKILETLKKYNVKGTFFVVGSIVDQKPEIVKTLSENQMAIFPHCYIHNYNKIYKSEEVYMDDLNRCFQSIEKATGGANKNFVRFPGGSVNTLVNKRTFDDIKTRLKKESINYVDWNVSSEDSVVYRLETNKVVKNVVEGYKGSSIAVVLMHDAEAKGTTATALPYIIESLQSNGYEFKTFNNISKYEMEKMIALRILNR